MMARLSGSATQPRRGRDTVGLGDAAPGVGEAAGLAVGLAVGETVGLGVGVGQGGTISLPDVQFRAHSSYFVEEAPCTFGAIEPGLAGRVSLRFREK